MTTPDQPEEARSHDAGDPLPDDLAPAEDASNDADWDLSEEEIAAAEVLPVTIDRVRGMLKTQNHAYLTRPDGQLAGIWNGSLFTFTVTARVFQVRGTWNRTVTIERREEFMSTVNGVHLRNPWPKCLLQVLDDGSMRLAAEMNTPIEAGLSDQQLNRAIKLGVGSGLSLFTQLGKQYPDPLMQAGTA